VQVDAVQQRSADLADIALNNAARAAAFVQTSTATRALGQGGAPTQGPNESCRHVRANQPVAT